MPDLKKDLLFVITSYSIHYTKLYEISRYEFDSFIDMLTGSAWLEDLRVDGRERMSKTLVEKEILNVSVVFVDDLVGHGRKLPWRVEATLSRLSYNFV